MLDGTEANIRLHHDETPSKGHSEARTEDVVSSTPSRSEVANGFAGAQRDKEVRADHADRAKRC